MIIFTNFADKRELMKLQVLMVALMRYKLSADEKWVKEVKRIMDNNSMLILVVVMMRMLISSFLVSLRELLHK